MGPIINKLYKPYNTLTNHAGHSRRNLAYIGTHAALWNFHNQSQSSGVPWK